MDHEKIVKWPCWKRRVYVAIIFIPAFAIVFSVAVVEAVCAAIYTYRDTWDEYWSEIALAISVIWEKNSGLNPSDPQVIDETTEL